MIDMLTREELKRLDISYFVKDLISAQEQLEAGSRRQLVIHTENISDVVGVDLPLVLEASVGGPDDVYYRLRLNAGGTGYVLGSSHHGRNSEFTKSLSLPFLVEMMHCIHTIEDFFDIYHFFADPELLHIQ